VDFTGDAGNNNIKLRVYGTSSAPHYTGTPHTTSRVEIDGSGTVADNLSKLKSSGMLLTGTDGNMVQVKKADGTNQIWVDTAGGGLQHLNGYRWRGFAGNFATETIQLDPSGSGTVALLQPGGALKVKEGTNATMGVATLVAGTVTVSTTKVTASSRIFLTGQNSSGTHGELTVSARTAGTSFTITSSSGTDTRSVAWLIMEPSP
jgi:hypothetical protein